MKSSIIKKILESRDRLYHNSRPNIRKESEEGGCGVTGFACSIPVGGRHIFEPSLQMHNRGNGKGGGIAAAGLVAADLGVSQSVLDDCYMIQVALLEPEARGDVEKHSLLPYMDIQEGHGVPTLDDYREVKGLEVKPPDVWRYFVRVKKDVLAEFASQNRFKEIDSRKVEDEYIWQNTIKLNRKFYDAQGDKKAFVLSQGRNMMIMKIVGYAEQVAEYYRLEDFHAHIWIAHQRYPTKGRVWHPAGAHPFMGLDEALVHNGDFANYYSVSEYLKQNNIFPHFLTDTEVAVLMFDLLNRVYGYPLEYIIETLAPTSEMDFDQLPEEKQRIYGLLQSMHINGSPDGPWFFIIARNDYYNHLFQLIGITDTAMLRPQVFAFHDGEVQVGLICSEKQAIDATLASLAAEDPRICPVADKYWNARGGSHTDGGAFIFTISDDPDRPGQKRMVCTDKFGREVRTPEGREACDMRQSVSTPDRSESLASAIAEQLEQGSASGLYQIFKDQVKQDEYNRIRWLCQRLIEESRDNDDHMQTSIQALTMINDRRFSTGKLKRNAILNIINSSLKKIFGQAEPIGSDNGSRYRMISWDTRAKLIEPARYQTTLILDASGFPPEGDDCDARLICRAYEMGWKKFICYGYRGQRFLGCGLGPGTENVRIDVYGSSGDYLSSGIDGMTIEVHGNAQDQLGQIMKSGKLVIYGDVGQTFLYGAKGGETYVMGNAAGRPLINAVGRPKVVINGTALDYLAESFMAGDPHNGGGFVILNGVEFDDEGRLRPKATPYPGSNLFSLASGGAIYVRDPHRMLVEEQLNGGAFDDLTNDDWRLILPMLRENEKLFGISVEEDLLTVDGVRKSPQEVYWKIIPQKVKDLNKETVEE
jgi:glutamate synthase domain-containing protein 1/glutamate synthase domain-containing protein 3